MKCNFQLSKKGHLVERCPFFLRRELNVRHSSQRAGSGAWLPLSRQPRNALRFPVLRQPEYHRVVPARWRIVGPPDPLLRQPHIALNEPYARVTAGRILPCHIRLKNSLPALFSAGKLPGAPLTTEPILWFQNGLKPLFRTLESGLAFFAVSFLNRGAASYSRSYQQAVFRRYSQGETRSSAEPCQGLEELLICSQLSRRRASFSSSEGTTSKSGTMPSFLPLSAT